MVIVDPYPLFPGPWEPNYPWGPGTGTGDTIVYPSTPTIIEKEKKWRERHIKNVKKGIMIFFEDGEQPMFIATDDKCWDKIKQALKEK